MSETYRCSYRATIGHTFTLEHTAEGEWHIWVTDQNGHSCYDGYWDRPYSNAFDALTEALRGSELDLREKP